MKILVTGAHGFLGRSLLRLKWPAERIGCGRTAAPVAGRPCYPLELTDRRAVDRLLENVRPDWVVHTAALTDVDQCETDRELARQVNLETVSHLVQACGRVDAGLVQLSTDYVFDGSSGPYSEMDETNPLSYYGTLKLESESLVLKGGIKGLVLRTLWLYGYLPETRPNFVTRSLEALSRGEELRIFNDQWGNPTYVHDLAQTVLVLCHRDIRGLFHMGGATFLTRYELVLELARFFHLDAGLVEPVATQAMGLSARRPMRSGLRTSALEAVLERPPLGFVEGLERMQAEEDFRRDFSHLL